MKTVSVIIPVYNTEKYIIECIESLLSQTLENCEFIFVNDGSKDNCKSIIESYQEKDDRIILINQENQGVSVARNTGIAVAKGEYIGFVDADDYVENNFFYQLFTSAKKSNSEIIVSNFNTEIEGKIISNMPLFEIDKQFLEVEVKNKIMPFFIEKDTLNSACNKIYKADLIKSNNIIFPLGIANGEDGLFNMQAFYKTNSAFFIDYSGYFYRDVAESATRNSIKHDFFKYAIDKYNIDYNEKFGIQFESVDLNLLKATRLINTVISLIHIYLGSRNQSSFKFKYCYVKNMISNKIVQNVMHKYWHVFYKNKPIYKQYTLYCIKIESFLGLFLGTKYSNFRN